MALESAVAGLPGLGSVVCGPAVAALGVPGCGSGGATGIAGAAAAIPSQLAGFGVGSILDAVGGWVASGAAWLLGQLGSALGQTTAIDLRAGWFASHYAAMAAIAAVLAVPFLFLGVIQHIVRGAPGAMWRGVLVHLPAAGLGTAAATGVVQIALAATDALCRAVAGGVAGDTRHALAPIATAIGQLGATGSAVPSFITLVLAVGVALGAFALWLELVVRTACVYAATLFLPLTLAAMVWPAVAHWSRRLLETLCALVLSKFVIVAVLSLGAGELAAGTSGHAGGPGPVTAVIGGAALLLLASCTPFVLLRIIPAVEAGAVHHLEGAGRRLAHHAAAPALTTARAALATSQWGGALAAGGAAADLPAGATAAAREGLAREAGIPGSGGAGPAAGVGDRPGVPGTAAVFERAMAGPDGERPGDPGASA